MLERLTNGNIKNIWKGGLYSFIDNFPILAMIVLFFSSLISSNFTFKATSQQYSYLADSFLNGKLYFLDSARDLSDYVRWNDGHLYWPLGPFPAVMLAPFVYAAKSLNLFFYQGYLNFFLVILIFALCFRVAKKIAYSSLESLYLAFAFCFASMFIGVAFSSASWYLAHVVTVLFCWSSILEFLGKKRYWLIGIFFALILATRTTAALGIIFFILTIMQDERHKIKKIIQLLAPIVLVLGILLAYNHFRFGSYLEQGYSLQTIGTEQSPSLSLIAARNYGLLSLKHVPGNIYYSLLSMPLPVFRDSVSHVLKFPYLKGNDWGMSIFITSPYLIYLFLLKYKDRFSRNLIWTILIIALPVYLYYGIGWIQYGYRYALDFMPLLFFLLMKNYKNNFGQLSPVFKKIIIFSGALNYFLYYTWIVK